MEYKVEDICKDVRVCLDMNLDNSALKSIGDVDTLEIDDIIRSKIADAARSIERDCETYMLDRGEAFATSVEWDGQKGIGSGSTLLPDDFLRLVSFKMSDWDYACTTAISEDSTEYTLQKSRYYGLRGNPQSPVVAIVHAPTGLKLEFYSCEAGSNVNVEHARYIPIPMIRDGRINVCEKLYPAIVHYTASLAAMTLGNNDMATVLKNMSEDLAK